VAESFHRRFLSLVEEIERNFDVAHWKCGDVDIWPLARMDLYLDMHWKHVGGSPPRTRPFLLRALACLATPLRNGWRSRGDFKHWVLRPRPAHAIFLGDGVSLDRVNGEWQDRFGEPLMAELERRGLASFVMQSGERHRQPSRRPTFSANRIGAWGLVAAHAAALGGSRSGPSAELPDHERLLRYLADRDVPAPSLSRPRLERRAKIVLATASAFERVLRIVKPRLAFVVTYYAGLGAAFLVACRRRGILSVDLQHCPQDGAHKAYGWHVLPSNGYSVLPAVFWTWSERDAAHIRDWANRLEVPWHGSVHGGHTQLAAFLDERDPAVQSGDERFRAAGKGRRFAREILIALQPIGAGRAQWEALAQQIEAGPPDWRWWIRRHPAAGAHQDEEYGRLLSLRMPNVETDEASSMPLPALLRHMSVLVSLASGAAAEAAAFGVPALFLSAEAEGPFAGLMERGCARVIDVEKLNLEIARLGKAGGRSLERPPPLAATLRCLEECAQEYSDLRRRAASQDEAGRAASRLPLRRMTGEPDRSGDSGQPGDATAPPTVSVIIPTFNRTRFLKCAVESVFAQTYEDWEIVLADDGSAEETRDYLRSIASARVRVVWLDHCANPSRVRNAAIRSARGRYLAFLDSDDLWAPSKLERQMAALRGRANSRWSYTACNRIDAEGQALAKKHSRPIVRPEGWIFEELLTLRIGIAMPTVLAERALVAEAGGFDEQQRFAEFHDLCLRLAMHGEVAALAEPLCSVRTHHEHYSSDAVADHAGWMRLYDKMQRFTAVPTLRAHCWKMREETALRLARAQGAAGDFRGATKTLARALLASWPYPRWWWGVMRAILRMPMRAAVKARKRADPTAG